LDFPHKEPKAIIASKGHGSKTAPDHFSSSLSPRRGSGPRRFTLGAGGFFGSADPSFPRDRVVGGGFAPASIRLAARAQMVA
jgi:hypothetical protein